MISRILLSGISSAMPQVANICIASENSASVTPSHFASAVAPSPSISGVFGIQRMIRASGIVWLRINSAEMPAQMETMTCSLRRFSASSTPPSTCGLTASTRKSTVLLSACAESQGLIPASLSAVSFALSVSNAKISEISPFLQSAEAAIPRIIAVPILPAPRNPSFICILPFFVFTPVSVSFRIRSHRPSAPLSARRQSAQCRSAAPADSSRHAHRLLRRAFCRRGSRNGNSPRYCRSD